jgi:hypothetical protein
MEIALEPSLAIAGRTRFALKFNNFGTMVGQNPGSDRPGDRPR